MPPSFEPDPSINNICQISQFNIEHSLFTVCIVEKKAGCDFPITPSSLTKESETPMMDTLKILTLLLVIFGA